MGQFWEHILWEFFHPKQPLYLSTTNTCPALRRKENCAAAQCMQQTLTRKLIAQMYKHSLRLYAVGHQKVRHKSTRALSKLTHLCHATAWLSGSDCKIWLQDGCWHCAAGPVSKIRLLGDYHHPKRIAFVEFTNAESARAALNCSGALLGMPFALLFSTWRLSRKEHAHACNRQVAVIGGSWMWRRFYTTALHPNILAFVLLVCMSIVRRSIVTVTVVTSACQKKCGDMQDPLQCAFLHPRHLSDQTPATMTHLCQDAVCADSSVFSGSKQHLETNLNKVNEWIQLEFLSWDAVQHGSWVVFARHRPEKLTPFLIFCCLNCMWGPALYRFVLCLLFQVLWLNIE